VDRAMNIQEGMTVYGAGDRQIGRVERIHGDGFDVAGQHYGRDSVIRVEHNRVYVGGTGMTEGRGRAMAGQTAGDVRVPVAEERLAVGKREAELGEVQVRKSVTEEQQTVPVTLQREEVRVHEHNIPDRPLQSGDDAFNEGTIRVPVRGEEAVVAKEAVVTGEVVIDKNRTSEQRQVSDTVRKQNVDVDENYQRARSGFEQEFTSRKDRGSRTFAQAEPNYRAGYTAAHDERYAGRRFEDVEPELRREYETRSTGTTGSGESWEHLRQEIRSGWNRARNS
jgi:uncharacterized protein (TIGR02271 family)